MAETAMAVGSPPRRGLTASIRNEAERYAYEPEIHIRYFQEGCSLQEARDLARITRSVHPSVHHSG